MSLGNICDIRARYVQDSAMYDVIDFLVTVFVLKAI